MVAIGWLLVVLVGLTQLCVAWYWRAVVHDAAARAARAAAVLDADPGACADTFALALGDRAADAGVAISPVRCTSSGTVVTASAGYEMSPWLPLWPSWTSSVAVPAVVERLPDEPGEPGP